MASHGWREGRVVFLPKFSSIILIMYTLIIPSQQRFTFWDLIFFKPPGEIVNKNNLNFIKHKNRLFIVSDTEGVIK
jgi:hypothetical protein